MTVRDILDQMSVNLREQHALEELLDSTRHELSEYNQRADFLERAFAGLQRQLNGLLSGS